MGLIMVDALLGRNRLDSLAERIAGIRIAVKFGEGGERIWTETLWSALKTCAVFEQSITT